MTIYKTKSIFFYRSFLLNSKIAGLTENKAKKLIDYRNKHGLFVNRQQILDVPTIGPKTFQQCAGFLTIRETTSVKRLNLRQMWKPVIHFFK